MAFRKFGPNDININTMKAHPKSEFVIYDSDVYYNNRTIQSGAYCGNVTMLSGGFVSLYEYNIDRTINSFPPYPNFGEWNPMIYPFVTKDSSRISFKNTVAITASVFNNEFGWGDIISGTYPQYASITREWVDIPASQPYSAKMNYISLKNTLNLYGVRSAHYKVNSIYGDKDQQYLNLIHVPSIFYGTRIKPGTVSMKMYYTGTLLGELRDSKENGELIQISGKQYYPAGTGMAGEFHQNVTSSVAGVVLYDEGFLLLTGSWPIGNVGVGNLRGTTPMGEQFPRWRFWGAGCNDGLTSGSYVGTNPISVSQRWAKMAYTLEFEGTTKTQTISMLAHAKRGKVNFSHNPTFLEKGQRQVSFTSSHVYEENNERLIKNTVSSSYSDYSASFKRQVYVSKIGIYDVDKNLIGIASLADPVLKEEDEDITFRIKLDI